MKNGYKKMICFSVCGLALFGAARLYYRLTDDFRLGNITYPMSYRSEWEFAFGEGEKSQLDRILSQKFTYIGKGAQSYAFVSEDDKYVLKFFKFKHLVPHWFVEMFPPFPPFSTYRKSQALRKQRKLNGVFDGYSLAYKLHKEPSGLIYAHLNCTEDLHQKVTVIDKLGFERMIDLDEVPFLIQDKAKTTRSVLQEALKRGDRELAIKRMNQIFELYLSEYSKGIYDKDHGVLHNTGFVGETPIHLDVGKLTQAEQMKTAKFWQEDLETIAWKFALFYKNHYPNDYQSLSRSIELKLTELFGRPFDFNKSTPPVKKRRR
jgi:hypothetical protein